MSSWNQGYFTDVTYTNGYYGTLNPLRIKLCFLAQRLLPPTINTACELGFGQGITLNFNASSANAEWYGTDFNPSQTFFAQTLANVSKAPLKIYDDSFQEFLSRKDLPQFDFIALHGIYAWVTKDIQNQILDFIYQKLNVGGVCLISYNCQAGWASVQPYRDLLLAYSNTLAPLSQSGPDRARAGLNFVNHLMSLPCSDVLKNAKLNSVLNTVSKADNTYLAHEFLNENHSPYNFLEMTQMMGKAKLEFASYANFADHLTGLQLLPQEKELLSQVSHNRTFYEMLKDLMFATSFRSDYWARGVVRLSESEAFAKLLDLEVILSTLHSKIDYEIKTYRGSFKLNESFYSPILKTLSQNTPTKVSKIKEDLEKSLKREVLFSELMEALIALSDKNYIKLAQEEQNAKKSKEYTSNLNAHILKSSTQSHNTINYLISPITGEAITLNRFEMMFLYASTLSADKKDWVKFVADVLKKSGEKLTKEGKELDEKEMLEEFNRQAESIEEWIPLFKKLQVI